MPVPSLLGASQTIPGLMQNQNVQAFTQGLGAAFNPPLLDTMTKGAGYFAGAPVNMGTAKERGLAGVLGGTIDNITGGMTDIDKRGDSKKQKDTKDFLRKFIFGTQGDAARKTRDEMGGGDITSFSPGERPGEFNYSFDANPNTQMMKPSPGFAGMI